MPQVVRMRDLLNTKAVLTQAVRLQLRELLLLLSSVILLSGPSCALARATSPQMAATPTPLFTAPVAASDASLVQGEGSCEQRLCRYLWLSCGLAVLVALIGMLYKWKRAPCQVLLRRFQQQQQTRGWMVSQLSNPANVRLLLCGIGFVVVCAWGVAGVTLSSGCYRSEIETVGGQTWQTTLTAVVASTCLLVALALLVRTVVSSVQTITPGQEVDEIELALRGHCDLFAS